MNTALFRLLLACLLSLAIPLQGLAALGASQQAPCGMSALEMSMMADSMPAHGTMDAGTATDTRPGAHAGTCPHCSSHCASMNLAPLTAPPPLALHDSGKQPAFPPLIQPLPSAPVHLPERPPRA